MILRQGPIRTIGNRDQSTGFPANSPEQRLEPWLTSGLLELIWCWGARIFYFDSYL